VEGGVGEACFIKCRRRCRGKSGVVDGNHDLAGENLRFEVEILEVREATKYELEHGHVHGKGCSH